MLELWKNRAHCGKLHQGELEQVSERCGKKTKETSARKCMKMKMSFVRGLCGRRARTSSGKKSPAIEDQKIEEEEVRS